MKTMKSYTKQTTAFSLKAIIALWLLSQLFTLVAIGQSTENVKSHTQELSKAEYMGRGYEHGGDLKAAKWIASQFETIGLEKFNDSYFQHFGFSINTLPSEFSLSMDGISLVPGQDFIIQKSCNTTHSTYPLIYIGTDGLKDMRMADSLSSVDVTSSIAAIDIDLVYSSYRQYKESMDAVFALPFAALIYLTDNPLRSFAMYGTRLKETVILEMKKDKVNSKNREVSLKVDTEFHQNYVTQNVIGYLEGKKRPNEYVIIGGHYDHLGMMGKHVFFPGADDNASGVAVVIEFARYFSNPKNRPDCSVIFMCFGGEEVGLLGAEYFANNCPVDPAKIKTVINLDMVAFGEGGFRVEHGDVLKEQMSTMRSIIDKNKLNIELQEAEAKAHSDHYPFIEVGIPALFITSGVKESVDYHTVNDNFESLPFSKIDELLILIREFVYSF
jgi:aminopeptidase YwaD